jgi:hypothetical protein
MIYGAHGRIGSYSWPLVVTIFKQGFSAAAQLANPNPRPSKCSLPRLNDLISAGNGRTESTTWTSRVRKYYY